jgi:predicted metal-dependent phosphoesterase TrpH
VHTTRSGDVCDLREDPPGCHRVTGHGMTPREMVAYAAARGLDYVAITDHGRDP